MTPEEIIAKVRAQFVGGGIAENPDLSVMAQAITDELNRLRPLADEGAQARARLIDEALIQGVRAYGGSFARETYKQTLQSLSPDMIIRMKDDWKTIGDQRFPAGRLVSEPEIDGRQPVFQSTFLAGAFRASA